MNPGTPQQAYDLLVSHDRIDYDKSFSLAQLCSKLLRRPETESIARDLIIRSLDIMDRFPRETTLLWNDLVEASGLYPYVNRKLLSGAARLRQEYHKSAFLEGIFFHQDQALLASELRSGMSVIASAPTSFGKSLLIDEVVASNKYRNIVVIQPTLALLDETRKRFRHFQSNYNIVLSTAQFPSELKGNLFLFTAERVVEYTAFPPIEFFVIDEFYKLSLDREDDRAITLNQAFYKLLKHTKSFYLLGPWIQSIPSTEDSGIQFHWYPSTFATVATEEIALAQSMRSNTHEKRQLLFETLAKFREPTIIYCAAPQGAADLAAEFGSWLDLPEVAAENLPDDIRSIQEWVLDNIAPEWCLVSLLGKGIGFHHGALPRHLGSAIVDSFNNGDLQFLFCTSTLIEGVNTSAKNVVLYDKKKGVRPIDYFDFRNIAGRSGRMFKHFIGRVYKFENTPPQLDLHVDFPILTQTNAPTELLLTIDESDLKEVGREKIAKYDRLEPELKKVLRENPALPLEGQLKIINTIQENIEELFPYLSWRSFPSYQQLLRVLQLAWDNLRRPNESKGGVVSVAQLAVLTLQYSHVRSLRGLIRSQLQQQFWIDREPDYQRRVDKVVFQVLSVSRHWFDYKLPSFLIAVSNLQRFVLESNGLPPGDYSAYATQTENGFLAQRFSDLGEYGIPRSAISKISAICRHEQSVDEILASIRRTGLARFGFTSYEMAKVRQAI